MKALVLRQKNELPELNEVPIPGSGNNESLINLRYSALNHRDVWITKGMYPKIGLDTILGSDGMGYMDDKRVLINPGKYWGEKQSHQSKSFEVLGMPSDGTFAEWINIQNGLVHYVPAHLSDPEAAALPLGGVTAYRTLFSRCKLKKDELVLINGTGGGVAHFALLFSIATGAEVYVTSGSDAKIKQAIKLGAKEGVNYKKDRYQENLKEICPQGFDVIIDSAAGDQFSELVNLCAPGGRIGIYGGTLGKIKGINPQILFWRQISILGSTMGSEKDFSDMLGFVEQHKIHPVIDKIIPLSEFDKGFQRLEESEQFGKVVFDHNA